MSVVLTKESEERLGLTMEMGRYLAKLVDFCCGLRLAMADRCGRDISLVRWGDPFGLWWVWGLYYPIYIYYNLICWGLSSSGLGIPKRQPAYIMEWILNSAQLGSIKSKHQTYVVNMGISCEPSGNRKQPGQVVYHQSGRKCPRNVDHLKT